MSHCTGGGAQFNKQNMSVRTQKHIKGESFTQRRKYGFEFTKKVNRRVHGAFAFLVAYDRDKPPREQVKLVRNMGQSFMLRHASNRKCCLMSGRKSTHPMAQLRGSHGM